jgi:hypothetical protein
MDLAKMKYGSTVADAEAEYKKSRSVSAQNTGSTASNTTDGDGKGTRAVGE